MGTGSGDRPSTTPTARKSRTSAAAPNAQPTHPRSNRRRTLTAWAISTSAPQPPGRACCCSSRWRRSAGAQSYVASLLPALVGRFDVTVAAHGAGPLRDAAEAAGVRFVPLANVRRPVNPFRDLAGLVELVRLLRRERPDILHANSSKAGVLGRLAAALTGVPIRIFTAHGWAFAAHSGLAARGYRVADRLMRPLTTATICVSEREREAGWRHAPATTTRRS